MGIEDFIEARIQELKKALGVKAPSMQMKAEPVKPTKVQPAKVAVKAKKSAKTQAKSKAPKAMPAKQDGLATLLAMLDKAPRKAELIKMGKEKDQLVRSLVPLYVARNTELEVNSGLISRFWKNFGLNYAPPNAAKALRNHVGYARDFKSGKAITPNGVKYVEAALAKLNKKAA